MATEVRENSETHRFEIYVDGDLAGFTGFEQRGGNIAFMHTEIADRFGGRGLGSTLIKAALDTVRERGAGGVLPYCPFVKAYIEKHPEYVSLIPSARRRQFGFEG